MIIWILIIGFLLFLLILAPMWPDSRGWSFYPSGTIAVLLVLLLLFWTFGLLPPWVIGH